MSVRTDALPALDRVHARISGLLGRPIPRSEAIVTMAALASAHLDSVGDVEAARVARVAIYSAQS